MQKENFRFRSTRRCHINSENSIKRLLTTLPAPIVLQQFVNKLAFLFAETSSSNTTFFSLASTSSISLRRNSFTNFYSSFEQMNSSSRSVSLVSRICNCVLLKRRMQLRVSRRMAQSGGSWKNKWRKEKIKYCSLKHHCLENSHRDKIDVLFKNCQVLLRTHFSKL